MILEKAFKFCRCNCHTNPQVKHIAACCCPHRYKNKMDCPQCKGFYEKLIKDMCGEILVDQDIDRTKC